MVTIKENLIYRRKQMKKTYKYKEIKREMKERFGFSTKVYMEGIKMWEIKFYCETLNITVEEFMKCFGLVKNGE
jgi:transcription-repair coupling factor (superfamily II helicase)